MKGLSLRDPELEDQNMQEWFPIWLLYVCGVFSYPLKALHFAFQIRYQTLVCDMMVNEPIRPIQAG
jgi:hypothetical protein